MRKPSEFLLLGCGYTAQRVARRLREQRARVVCTNRRLANLAGCECVGLDATNPASVANLLPRLSSGMAVLHSIPPDGSDSEAVDFTQVLLDALRPLRPARVVYLSTTGVYGLAQDVDGNTPAAPDTARDRLRVAAEELVAAGDWPALILRPAAIYGPGRGVHHSVRQGAFRIAEGGGRIISRIHVEDLAAQAAAGLCNDIQGAFPVADEEPCASVDVAQYTAHLLGLKLPLEPTAVFKVGRRVDGSAYRKAARLELMYPSYREGVKACLEFGFEVDKPGKLPYG